MIDSALFEQVLAQPADDAPRLACADWLEERGDPRGEFIRVQCELARSLPCDSPWPPAAIDRSDERRRLEELKARESELLLAHGAIWSAPLQDLTAGVGFRRGFVEHVRLPAEAFVERAPALRQSAPLRALTLAGDRDRLGPLLDSPLLEGIEALALDMHLGHGGMAALAASAYARDVRALDLTRGGVERAGFAALAASPALAELEILILNQNRGLCVGGIETIREAPHWKRLAWVELASCGLMNDDARKLETWPGLKQLMVLNLSGNDIGAATLDELIASPYWPQRMLFEIGQRRFRSLRFEKPSPYASQKIRRLRTVSETQSLGELKRSALPWGVSPTRRWGGR